MHHRFRLKKNEFTKLNNTRVMLLGSSDNVVDLSMDANLIARQLFLFDFSHFYIPSLNDFVEVQRACEP